MDKAFQNTDKEIYIRPPKDWKDEGYTPKLFITEHGALGINLNGHVRVQEIEDWFRMAKSNPPASTGNEDLIESLKECLEETKYALECVGMTDDEQEVVDEIQAIIDRAEQALAKHNKGKI